MEFGYSSSHQREAGGPDHVDLVRLKGWSLHQRKRWGALIGSIYQGVIFCLSHPCRISLRKLNLHLYISNIFFLEART